MSTLRIQVVAVLSTELAGQGIDELGAEARSCFHAFGYSRAVIRVAQAKLTGGNAFDE